MATILAFDTSSESCSVALNRDGTLTERFEHAPRQQAQRILPMIHELLQSQQLRLSELDAVAFACGPGSFTGLRIAAGIAQGLAFGIDCPVIPVSSLRALAVQAYRDGGCRQVLATIDARMDELYWGLYQLDEDDSGLVQSVLVGKERVSPADALSLESLVFGAEQIADKAESSVHACGSGLAYAERFPENVTKQLYPGNPSGDIHAAVIAELAAQDLAEGKTCPADQAAPVYIRDEVAWKKLPGRG